MEIFKVDKDHSGLNKCPSSEDSLYKVLTTQLHKIRPTAPRKINMIQQAVLDRLISLTASDAEFHPGFDESGRGRLECHPQTREEILKDIYDWLNDCASSQKHLYWLQGKAGTGKSTIARTIVSRMAKENRIAANFFFKRGEGDRARLKRFFTTLTAQLVRKWPIFANAVQDVLEPDPSLSEQDPGIQFKKLIQEPMRKQRYNNFKTIIIVIDALDECDSSEDLKTLVQQLTQPILQNSPSAQLLVKYFVTSRLDNHTRPVSNKTPEESCEKKELEQATSETIKRDIELYLRFQLEKIDGLLDPLPGGDSWSNPSDAEILKKLTERACPLFEFAATACRFITQTTIPSGPPYLLHDLLESNISGDLDGVYAPILKRRFYNLRSRNLDRAKTQFQHIVGSFIILADSVTVTCLAQLLGQSERAIRDELQLFESVIVIPTEQDNQSSVKLFHESFRDFLIGPEANEEFNIDSTEAHALLASRCCQLLRKSLQQNICKLKTAGTHRSEIVDETLNEFLPQEVQYACRFWIFHIISSQLSIRDGDDWHSFLLSHLLHWLEAMSLLGRTSESASLVKELKTAAHPSDGAQVKEFLEDAERLILSFRHIIDAAPLQLYSSVLTFAPTKSLIRENFDNCRAKWISRTPNVNSQWNLCLQTLEGHVGRACCVSFSSGGILASADADEVVKVWDPISGTCLQTFSMDTKRKSEIISMAFSKAGKLACLALERISVWDIQRGICLQTLDLMQYVQPESCQRNGLVVFEDERKLFLAGMGLRKVLKLELGHECEEESALPFDSAPNILSPDGQWVAYAISGEIRVLDINYKANHSPKTLKEATSESDDLNACFSRDNRYFASVQYNRQAKVWDVSTTMCLQVFNGIDCTTALAFSQDSRLLGMANDGKISIWDWKTHSRLQTLAARPTVNSISFSPDGTWLAPTSYDRAVQIWDTTVHDCEERGTPFLDTRDIKMVMGGQRLATLIGKTLKIQLLDDSRSKCITKSFKEDPGLIAISANGNILAVALYARSRIELWDAESGNYMYLPGHYYPSTWSIALSANGERLIVGMGYKVKVWESRTGRLLKEWKSRQLRRYYSIKTAISFDGEQIAWTESEARKDEIRIYIGNLRAGTDTPREFRSTFDSEHICFSQNGKRLATVDSRWEGAIWDVATGACLREFNRGYTSPIPTWNLTPSFINFDFTVDIESPGCNEGAYERWEDYLTKYHISLDGAWVMRNREKLLWILPEYRPGSATISGSNIAIARVSGHPFVIGLSDEGL
ncbi:hypothetical protein GGI35DRAFT_487487 [Trichoderma velutinum]